MDDATIASLKSAPDGTPALIAGRYELRDSIGRGAFGEVFEAYDRVLGRLVAVKVLPVTQNLGAEGRESLRRFQVEARALSRLKHPNIVTIHDFGQGERFAWFVMELVIGETLADALRGTGPPPILETSRILCALLSALHAAHERGIVHRDVKPANIMLEMNLEDGLGEVRLTDFGVAQAGVEERTAIDQMIGTPWVMAPEQVVGGAVDRRTDIWAAGVILYEMLTGQRPFKGTIPGIFHRIMNEGPPPPTSIRAELPPAVDALIGRALAKAPEDRFATAEEMAAAIRAALCEPALWLDTPPLPWGDPEAPAAGAPLPPLLPPQAAPPANRRFGHGLAVGLLGGLMLGVTVTLIAGMVPTSVADLGLRFRGVPEPPHAAVVARALPEQGEVASVLSAPAEPVPSIPAPERLPTAASAQLEASWAGSAPTALAPHGHATALAALETAQHFALQHGPASLLLAGSLTAEAVSLGVQGTLPSQRPDLGSDAFLEASIPVLLPEVVSYGVDASAEQLLHGLPNPPSTNLAIEAAAEAWRVASERTGSVDPPAMQAVALPPPAVTAPTDRLSVGAVQEFSATIAAAAEAAATRTAAPGNDALSAVAPRAMARSSNAPPPLEAIIPIRTARTAACKPERLRIRTGSHDGYGRIVFDWSGRVAYRITQDASGVGIHFPDAGCMPAAERIRPARNLSGADGDDTGSGLLLRVVPGAQVHDFRLGNRVVIDIGDAAR